jgi:hypothetical protein
MRYEFRIRGQVSPTITHAFPELSAIPLPEQGVTDFRGLLRDQAEVREILDRFEDLGLEVIGLRHVAE